MRPSDLYELLVRDIFDSLGKLEGVQNLKVDRKVYLDGLSTNPDGTKVKHEIDVCVTYEQFGMKHTIVIQAKHWKDPVDLPTLMAFKGVLSDLPGNPRGIMVTKSGFDKGNIFGVANTHNIGLYVLDEIGAGEFAPSIEITGEMTVDGVNVNAFDFGQPYDENLAKQILDSEIDAKEIPLYAEDGHQIGTLDGAMDQLAHLARQQGRKDGDPVALQFTIEGKKVYLHTDNPEIPRMQLARVIGTYFRKLLAAGKKETKLTHTLRLLTNDQTYYVDSDHNVYKTSGVFTGHLQLQGEHAGTTIQSEFALGAKLADLQDIHQDRKDKPNEEAREMRF